jgi:two-component system, OmpR family, sensor kinase
VKPSSLHARLATVLFVVLLVAGVVNLVSAILTSRLHHQEANQRTNLDLARNIVAMKYDQLLADEELRRGAGIQQLFHWLMVVNPEVQLYLLDLEGRVLEYDAQPGDVKLSRVDLEPVRRLLAGGAPLPVLGEDPRAPGRRTIFSVAPVPPEPPYEGYLYAVLATEEGDVAGESWGAQVLRLGIGSGLVALLVAASAGALLFRQLTRPLRRLARRMREVAGSDGGGPAEPPRGDEVELLERTFDAMHRRLSEQMAEIERLADRRHELIANVSHDLRTPLASLQGYLETVMLKEDSLDPGERREYLETALGQSQRLGRLVHELFELTKLDSEMVEPRKEPFSLAELVQDNVQRFQLLAAEKGVELTAELAPGLPLVEADIGMIERVLENLIDNAVRFTPEGGRVSLAARRDGDRLAVVVRDSGIGIPPEDLPRVFDRFVRGGGDGTPRGTGAGLGLAIARRILELHGGEIGVRSWPGEGTEVRFVLPPAGVPESDPVTLS